MKKCATFNEALELFRPYSLGLHLDLERHEDSEEELILLVESAYGVAERGEREVLDDILDALGGDGGLDGLCHRHVEDLKELAQGRLVHRVDDAHLDDEEIQDRTAGSDCKRRTSIV